MTNETATNPLALDFSPSRIRQHERSGVDEAESEVMGSGACQVGTMANGGGVMTKREAAIVSAYTGYLIGELGELYKDLSELIGRPVYTHEIPAISDKYHSRIRQDFVIMEVD